MDISKLNWKWSKGIKPSGRDKREVLGEMGKSISEAYGRDFSELSDEDAQEEAVRITDEIRKELMEKGELP